MKIVADANFSINYETEQKYCLGLAKRVSYRFVLFDNWPLVLF